MKIPVVKQVSKVSDNVLATRRNDYWVVVYDELGYAAWVCLDRETWVQDAPAPAGIVDQAKTWLRANWDKITLHELNFHYEERYAPNLRYGSMDRLREVIGA